MNELLTSSRNKFPLFHTLINHINNTNPRFLKIYHPLSIYNYGHKKNDGLMNVNSNNIIPRSSKILELSTECCFTGLELIGSDRQTTNKLNFICEKIAKKYHEFNPAQYYFTINLLKLSLQLFAHYHDPSMSLHHYANFLYHKVPNTAPLMWSDEIKSTVFSKQLLNLIGNQKVYMQSLAKDLDDLQIPGIKYDELLKLTSIIRSRSLNFSPENPRFFDKNTFLILSPVIDLLNHSFEPNCTIEGTYNSVDNESYIVLRSIKDINPNEELTLNYGDYSNYDFLMKFGFLNDISRYNEYHMKLDFDDSMDYINQHFELKQKIYALEQDFSIEKIILYKDRIDEKILSYLRVYFMTEDDVKANMDIYTYTIRDFKKPLNNANEKRIFEFLIKQIKREINDLNEFKKIRLKNNKNPLIEELQLDHAFTPKMYETWINKKDIIEDLNLINAIQIGLEEQYVLHQNLAFCQRKYNSLQKKIQVLT